MTQGQKLQQFIDYLKLSKLGFANSIGVSATVINSVVADAHHPGHKVLAGIKRTYPRFNTDWLLNGEGEMLLPDNEQPSVAKDYLQDYMEKLEDRFKALTDHFQNQLAVKDRQIEGLQKTVEVLLGKSDLSENKPCVERPMYQLPAA